MAGKTYQLNPLLRTAMISEIGQGRVRYCDRVPVTHQRRSVRLSPAYIVLLSKRYHLCRFISFSSARSTMMRSDLFYPVH